MSLYPSNAWARARPRSAAGTSSGSGCARTPSTCPGRWSTALAGRAASTTSTAPSASTSASRAPGSLYNTLLLLGPGGLLAPAPQADADDARAAVPRRRRGRRPAASVDAGRPRRRADLLGEPDAAGALGGLPGRPADLGRADGRRLRRLARQRCATSPSSRARSWSSAPQYIPAQRVPGRLPGAAARGHEVFGRGGAAIVEPTWGDVIAGPLYGEEGIVVADCDLRRGLHAKRWFDAVGHYSRADVLAPVATAPGGVAPPPPRPRPRATASPARARSCARALAAPQPCTEFVTSSFPWSCCAGAWPRCGS